MGTTRFDMNGKFDLATILKSKLLKNLTAIKDLHLS